MSRVSKIVLSLACCVLSAAAFADVDIVKGDSRAVVIVPAESGTETTRAALEISEYVGKITGRDLPVVVEGQGVFQRVGANMRPVPFAKAGGMPSGKPEIHVGWTERALKELDRAGVDALDMDGYRVKISPDAVFLVGPKDWSTAYAVFEFLETFCGVRWYLPGEFGEDVPRAYPLAVAESDKTYEPAYQHRQYSGFQWRNHPELRQWGMHARIRARLYYHHNLYKVFDVAKYAKDHPDLYPILNGRRRVPGPNNPGGWQPCLTHPMAVDVAMDYAREFFTKDPDAGSLSLGINDGGGYCECDRCLAVVDKDAPPQGDRATWFFTFANAVAARFDKEFPDKSIGYLLYGHVKEFPKGTKINPRLIGFYVYPSYTLITAEGKQKFEEALRGLRESVSRFALYDWFYGDGLVVPRMQIRQAKYWLEHGYEMGARHCKAEAYMNWGLDGFKYWMHARLLWDPKRDVDAMMDEFFPRFFKEAAGPMRDYFRIVEEYTVKPVVMPLQQPGGETTEARPVNFRFRCPEQLETFPPEAVERCLPLLEKAEATAASHIVRERVRYYRQAFDVARMMTLQYHTARQALPLLERSETLPQGVPLLVEALSPKYNVDQYYDWVLRGDDFCVRKPEESMFGVVTLCRSTAARTLSEAVIAELRGMPQPVSPALLEKALNDRLDAALSRIESSDDRNVASVTVAPYARKIVLCNRTDAPPAVDGRLDDPAWARAASYSDFVEIGSGRSAKFKTEFRLLHDGKRLYVGYTCHQDTKVLLVWTKERDGRVWREDGVELLINRPTDTKREQNFQLIVSAAGNIYDYFDGTDKWDGDIAVKTAIEPQFYTIEMSIPLDQIAIDPAKERFFRVNFVRNVYGRAELRSGTATETSAWNLTPFGNPDPRARGWLVLN